MRIKTHDIHSVSMDELNMYIVELKIQHDRTVAKTHDVGIAACAAQIREIEEELCWVEYEAKMRLEQAK